MKNINTAMGRFTIVSALATEAKNRFPDYHIYDHAYVDQFGIERDMDLEVIAFLTKVGMEVVKQKRVEEFKYK